MRYVPFGKTGLKVSELGFGGIPLIRLDKDSAVNVLRRAHDVEKYPYDLPIPDMLKSFYDLYEQHRNCLLT